MKIKLDEINDIIGTLERIQSQIFTELPSTIFFSEKKILVREVLDLFDFGEASVTPSDDKVIETHCLKILQLAGVYQDLCLNSSFKLSESEEDYSPIQHFVKYIIGLNRNPRDILNKIAEETKNDLKGILKLIEQYKTDPIIMRFLSEGKFGNTHEEMVKREFYSRCIEERDRIVTYIYGKMEERAIWKARLGDLDMALARIDAYEDRPYRWWLSRSIEFFDERKINQCRHRLREVPIRHLGALELLYDKGKKQLFYEELRKSLSVFQIFDAFFNYYLHVLPKIAEREKTLHELQELFEGKKWYGFTALALTQVEGIFSDMLHIINPKKKYSALSAKVSAVRPFYGLEERNFDYFEYCLPRLRNSFLHAGSILARDFEITSLDLLYDLNYLMSVFHELQDAHIELHKLIKKGNCDFIHGMEGLSDLMNLVLSVRKRNISSNSEELNETLLAWDEFEKTRLTDSGLLEYYADQWNATVNADFLQFFKEIEISTSSNGNKTVDLEALTMKEIMRSKVQILDSIGEGPYLFRERLNFMLDMRSFLQTYKTVFKNCPSDAKSIFDDILSKNKDRFAKVYFLKRCLDLSPE